MSKPWYDLAAKKLNDDDTIQKTYTCSYNKGNGYLCLGKKKLVFVNVKGFLKKYYDVTLDIPYSELAEVSQVSRFKMILMQGGSDHLIETHDHSVKRVRQGLQDVIGNSPELSVAFIEA